MILLQPQEVRDTVIHFFTTLYNTLIHSIMLELLTLMKFIEQSTSASIQLLLILEDPSILLIPPKAGIELVCIESYPGAYQIAVWVRDTGGRLVLCSAFTIGLCVAFNASVVLWFMACFSVSVVEVNLVRRLTDIQERPETERAELFKHSVYNDVFSVPHHV